MKIQIVLNKQDAKKIIEDYLKEIFKKVEGLPLIEFNIEFEGFK